MWQVINWHSGENQFPLKWLSNGIQSKTAEHSTANWLAYTCNLLSNSIDLIISWHTADDNSHSSKNQQVFRPYSTNTQLVTNLYSARDQVNQLVFSSWSSHTCISLEIIHVTYLLKDSFLVHFSMIIGITR